MSEGQEHKKYDLEGLDKDHSYDQHSVPIDTYELNQTQELDSGKSLDEIEQEPGVSRIETLYQVFGRGWKLYSLYLSLGLLCFAFSLESNTVYIYQQFAVSSFGAHPILGTIGILTQIMAGVIKPFIAKLADMFSRPIALIGATTLLVVGFIVTATAPTVEAYAAAQVLSTMGSTGIDLLFTILLGDISSLEWRGFTQGLASTPYIINAFVSPQIAAGIGGTEGDNWRWGYGMFCIIIPICVIPIVSILYWADRKATKLGVVSLAVSDLKVKEAVKQQPILNLIWTWTFYYWRRIDAFGLILLGFAFSLVLLPFSLYSSADNHWKNPSLIAMFVVGGITMIAFFTWEWKFASFPLMPRRVMNRTMICCIIIDFMYYLSGSIGGNYFTSWVYVVKDWSVVNYGYFTQTLGVALCFFGTVAGGLQRYTHRYKYLQFSGLCIRVIGMGLMFLAANGNQSDVVLVMSQTLVGLGGALSVIGSQVAVQASVPHRDMGTAIALLALWTSVGGGIGSAIGSAMWNDQLPKQLNKYVGDVFNATEIAAMYGDITIAHVAEPRPLVIQAYNDAAWYLMLVSLVLSVLPLPAGLLTTNYYLGNTQNAVEAKEMVIKTQQELEEEQQERMAGKVVA